MSLSAVDSGLYQSLGEELYPRIAKLADTKASLAGKVTGMLLEHIEVAKEMANAGE